MKKLVLVTLFVVFALTFAAAALVTPAKAIAINGCEEICRKTYYYYCCGGPGSETGCVIIGRCE